MATDAHLGPRKVGIPLGIGITIFPLIFSWFLLRNGHSRLARVLGFSWLVVELIAIITTHENPGNTMTAQVDTPSSRENPIKDAPKDIYHAYAYSSYGNAKYKNKFILVEGLIVNTDLIFKTIKGGSDIDNGFNLDSRIEKIPSKKKIIEEAKVYGIDPEIMRSTYPSIDLELSGESRGSKGMGNFGDFILVFNSHPEDLHKLKLGNKAKIVGQVNCWLNDAVVVRDCRLVP